MTDILLGAERLDTQERECDAGANPPRPHATAAQPAPIASERLLRGRSAVQIVHNGAVYRLQVTRHGKLILTK